MLAKWVDNVLSHYSVIGVEQGTRGVERRLTQEAILALAMCRMLARDLGVPLATAVGIANQVVGSREFGGGTFAVAPGLALQFSMDDLERTVLASLSDATESVAHVRRGRPASGARGA